MTKNEKLTSLKLNKDEEGYYLEAVYEYETESGKYRKVFPHIELNVYKNMIPYVDNKYNDIYTPFTIDLGFGKCILKKVDIDIPKTDKHDAMVERNCLYYIDALEEYAHELTMEEIEEKLGYKIKIVGKKD